MSAAFSTLLLLSLTRRARGFRDVSMKENIYDTGSSNGANVVGGLEAFDISEVQVDAGVALGEESDAEEAAAEEKAPAENQKHINSESLYR